MRKNIALILALVMILSLVPMTAFAASTNTIDRVPTVSDDHVFTTADAPELLIEERAGTTFGQEVFRLNLTNAEFTNAFFNLPGISRRTATSATVTDSTYFDAVIGSDNFIIIPMLTELQGEGEARVTIDPLSSAVSGGTLTFAIGATGDTVAFVDSVETVRRGTNQPAGTIIIDETTAGAITGAQEFRVRLPRDFSWHPNTEVSTEFLNVTGLNWVGTANDGRDLIVSFNATASTTRGSIIIEPVINVSRSASFGDVAVSITNLTGDVSSQTNLVIADYVDFGVDIDVEADGELEFFTGRYDDTYTVEITLEETTEGSFLTNRAIDFDLPGWVWITDINLNGDALIAGLDFDFTEGDNEFFYDIQGGEEELVFELTLTIEGNAAVDGPRDIPLTIAGAGIPETEVVIGIAKPAVMVEVADQLATVQAGLQRQAAPDITITETEAGAIMEGDLIVFMRDFFEDSMRVDSFDWEVIEGDIEIDDDSTAGGNLTLEIGAESEEASTILLSNIRVTLDRTVPMGPFRADIGGDALIENTNAAFDDVHNMDIRTGFVGRVDRFEYVNVGTPIAPVDPEVAQVVFTVGQMAYMVNGEMRMMDVAPFISEGRIMVPVRYMEELFGMQPIWNPTARTVTIMYNNQVFEMAIGSTMLRVNGAPFMEMETAAMIVDSRTFVPLSRFARAMNIPYVWDAATQTVTFN